ncbi:MAG: quinone-dependent dihydroorotate dehydrogenase [Rubellimicrobium sp.]|nr:quinone-dependent dihydroorotate dehydrogenase [Rubellimicrobium sp.]
MGWVDQAGLALLRRIDPETAHGLALKGLNAGLGPRHPPITSDRLRVQVAGLDLPNPLGLAAGFDKNAVALGPLARIGFGFVEAGGVTPRPQNGNTRPRLFRLSEDGAVINRFGFNNDGMEVVAARLAARPRGMVLGLNLGANKDSADRRADFATVLARCGADLDFATVNVSSPNTERLRELQGKAALAAILEAVTEANARLPRPIAIFVKIAPDLTPEELADVAEVARTGGVDALIATNTTISREGLKSESRSEAGGLSGQPLFEKSTRVLAQLSTMTDLPLIGVGGIASVDQAWEKIRAGASALQLYTGLIYRGLGLVDEIIRGLDARLEEGGFARLADAVGTGRDRWL